jgi:hypothetical protein
MARKQIIAGIVLAAIAVFSVPLAANASTGEGDSSSCAVSPSTIKAGGSTTFSCTAGTFGDSENVQFVVGGKDGSNITLASFHSSSVALTKLSASDGSTSLHITVPTDASGAYTITATGSTSARGGTATITVVPASDAVTSTTGVTTTSGGSGLADTGSIVSMTLLWAGGGVVALGLILLIVLALARRRHVSS